MALHRVVESWSNNGGVAMADLGLLVKVGEVCEIDFCSFRFQPTSDTASR